MSKLGEILSDPQMSEKIRAIAESVPPPKNAEDAAVSSAPSPPAPSVPPALPLSLLSGLGSGGSAPKTIVNGKALLIALKPFLDSERCEKIDRILSAMKLAEFAGIFKNLI